MSPLNISKQLEDFKLSKVEFLALFEGGIDKELLKSPVHLRGNPIVEDYPEAEAKSNELNLNGVETNLSNKYIELLAEVVSSESFTDDTVLDFKYCLVSMICAKYLAKKWDNDKDFHRKKDEDLKFILSKRFSKHNIKSIKFVTLSKPNSWFYYY